MTDFAKLVMMADTTSLKVGETSLDKLTSAAVRTEGEVQDAMAGIAAATGKVPPAAREAAEAFDMMPAATGRMNRGFTLGGNAARMMGMQLSQVGQQTMASGNFIQALAIQLPDIGLGFGAVGMAAGLLAGIALPLLAGAFGMTGSSAADLETLLDDLEAQTKSFADAVDTVGLSAEELLDKVGSASPGVRQLMLELAGIEKIKAYDTLKLTAQAAEDLFAPNWGVDQSIEGIVLGFLDLSSLLSSNRDLAAQFVAELDTLANTSDEMERLQAALDLKAVMNANIGGYAEMDDGQREVLALLNEIILKEQFLGTQSAELAVAGDELAAGFATADYSAQLLGGSLAEARREGTATAESIREIATAAGIAAAYADEVADSAGRIPPPINAATGEAGVLASALGTAASQASLLAAYMGALPGALAGFQAQAHAASAGLSAIKMGLDAATVSAAEFRGQQEAAVGMLTASEGPGMKSAAAAVDTVVAAYEDATSVTTEFRAAQTAAAAALAATAGAASGSAGAAGAIKEVEVALTAAEQAALDFSQTIKSDLEGAFDDLSQWIASGFDGGFVGMRDSFKAAWSDMVSFAVGNPIKQSLFGTAASGGNPATAGLLGSASSGFTGALTGSMAGGFGSMFNLSANIAAAGGGLGATLGALIGPLGLVLGLFSAFKTSTINLASGLAVSVDGLDLIANEFSTNQTSSFFGLIKKTSTTTNAVDADSQAQLDAIFGGINDAVTGSAAALGIGAAAFDTFSYDFNVSLKGLSQEDAARAIGQAFTGMSDAMAALALAGSGVTIPIEGAAAYLDVLASSLTAVNSANRMLGFDVLGTSISMGVLSEQIVAVYGSLEEFTAATSYFFENFYSREEQIAALSDNLDEQMAALNRTTPDTVAGFRAMVDAAQAAGNEALAAGLIDLADEFLNLQALAGDTAAAVEQMTAAEQERYNLQTQLYTLQGKTDLLRERELAAMDPTNRALQEQIFALQDLQTASAAAAQAADELAQAEATVAQERYDLQTQLYTLQGKTDLLRERELALLDPTNAALQEQIFALTDLQAANEAAAQAAEDLASAEAAVAQERYDLKTQLFTLQGKEDLLRERELALLSPTNQALQEQIWALEDLQTASEAAATAADELAQSEQAIADERMSLQRELWTLQGDTASLRADELAALDESNRALQEQIWLLEDQKAALEALDPNAYSTLFDFQRASALAANGYATANMNVPPAPMQTAPVQTTTAATDPMVVAINAATAEIILFRTEQRDLNMQTATNTGSIRTINQKWDGEGMPAVRA